MPIVEILEVHPLTVTDKLIAEALETKYGGLDLTAAEQREAEAAVRAEIGSADGPLPVVLIEAWVRGAEKRFDPGRLGQARSGAIGPLDQVAYDEAVLTDDGAAILGRDVDEHRGRDPRLAFFLHYYRPEDPILTPFGPVTAPRPTPMPERLAAIIRYEPVD